MGKLKINKGDSNRFRAYAASRGMSVDQMSNKILRNRERYSPVLIKRAMMARKMANYSDGGQFILGSVDTKRVRKPLTVSDVPSYKGGGIHINPKNKGKFNALKKRTGKSTEELTHSKNPLTRKRAIFAQNSKKWKHADGGEILPEYSLGGNIFKTVGGAAMVALGAGVTGLTGGLASPLGVAMASSGVGMMGSGISGFGDEAAAKRQAKDQELLNAQGVAQSGQADAVNPYQSTFRTGGKFKGKLYGNKTGAGNALVMDGEILIKPSGTVEKASNPGAPIADNIAADLADNTKIISRRNSAQLLKDVDKLNKAEKLKAGGVTSLTKNSLDKNINKYYARLFDVYNKQEAKKMAKGGQYKFQGGGPYGSSRYVAPDYTDLGLPYDEKTFNNAYGSLVEPSTTGPMGGIFYTKAEDNPHLEGFTPRPAGTGGTDWGGIATLAGELAPTIYNLGQGLFGKREMLNARDYRNPEYDQIKSLMADRRYNIDPDLAANEATFATNAANIRNLGGSRGRVSSNLIGAQNVKQFGDMSAYAQQKNMNNQYMGEQAQMMYPLGRDVSMTKYSVDEGNLMTKAAGRNMIGSGATGIQNYLLQKRYMKNQMAQSKLLASAIQGYGSGRANEWVSELAPWLKQYAR